MITEHKYVTKNGYTLTIKPIPQAILAQYTARFISNAPKPPMATVDFGAGPVQEPNPHDPDYKLKLEEFNTELGVKIIPVVFELSVYPDPSDLEDAKTRIEELKYGLSILGLDDDSPTPKVFFIRNIACGMNEIGELCNFIMSISQNTDNKGVEALSESFRSETETETDKQDKAA